MKMILAAALAAGLAACSSTPTPDVATRPPADTGPAARLARAALAEWELWNRPVAEGWPTALPAGTRPPDDHFERIMGYWGAVPEGPSVVAAHLRLRDAMSAPTAEEAGEGSTAGGAVEPALSIWAYPAWSAAFISHVMRRGGVWEAEVPAAAAHATYVDALILRAEGDPAAAFVPRDPTERAPRPGDLLCADRSRSPLLHWRDRLAEAGRFRPMHCDVVVSGRPGSVEAVGGNVLDSVALRRFPADDAGRVLPPPADKAPFFVVFENRMR